VSNDDMLHVLVIDDDDDLRRLLVDLVTRAGHQPVPASSAEEGLELLPFWTFQVAFLDYRLPGMDGLVLGEFLRRNNPDMSIVLVTADDDASLERRSKNLSIRFLAKPFEPTDVQRALEDYVELAKERRRQRLEEQASDFGPSFAEYGTEITECFGIPKVPNRIEERLVETLKRSLHNLRTIARYTERDRVVALSGLISAKVLGVQLPRAPSGRTYYEEYDVLMHQHGRRAEFTGTA
jgi:CheY-like chemotaxis protein